MAVSILALVRQEGEELLKCVLMDTGEQSVIVDGIAEMLMLCVDNLDSTHLGLLQDALLTLVEGLDQYY